MPKAEPIWATRAPKARSPIELDAVEVDIVTFGRPICDDTEKALAMAVEFYIGDLLVGFDGRDPMFEEWLRTERSRLKVRAIEALSPLSRHPSRCCDGWHPND